MTHAGNHIDAYENAYDEAMPAAPPERPVSPKSKCRGCGRMCPTATSSPTGFCIFCGEPPADTEDS